MDRVQWVSSRITAIYFVFILFKDITAHSKEQSGEQRQRHRAALGAAVSEWVMHGIALLWRRLYNIYLVLVWLTPRCVLTCHVSRELSYLYRKFTVDRHLSLFSSLRITLTAKQNKKSSLSWTNSWLSELVEILAHLECLANIKDHFPSTASINESERVILLWNREYIDTERTE